MTEEAHVDPKVTAFRREVLRTLHVSSDRLASMGGVDPPLTVESLPAVEETDVDRMLQVGGTPLPAVLDVYESLTDDRPINVLVDEDGSGAAGWKHTLEMAHAQFRTSSRLQIVTSVRICKLYAGNLEHCMDDGASVFDLDAPSLRSVQAPGLLSPCRPHIVNCVHVDASEFDGIGDADRSVSVIDTEAAFALARGFLVKTLRALRAPPGMFIDEHVFARQMPFVDPRAAFVVCSLLPECRQHVLVTSSSRRCILFWYMSGISAFNARVTRAMTRSGADRARISDMVLHRDGSKDTPSAEHCVTRVALSGILNHNAMPSVCNFDNVIPCYKSHAVDFAAMFDKVAVDMDALRTSTHRLERVLLDTVATNVLDGKELSYEPGQLEKLCYDGFDAFSESEALKAHVAFDGVARGGDGHDRIHVLLCFAAALLNCLVVLYDNSDRFQFCTHWPTVDALAHFRVIAVKRMRTTLSKTVTTEIVVPVKLKNTLASRMREIEKYVV